MKPLKEAVSITLDAGMFEKIKMLAKRQRRSASSYISLTLRKSLENQIQLEFPDDDDREQLPKRKVSITIDGSVLEKIKEICEYEDRPVSNYINLIMQKHLEQLAKEEE